MIMTHKELLDFLGVDTSPTAPYDIQSYEIDTKDIIYNEPVKVIITIMPKSYRPKE